MSRAILLAGAATCALVVGEAFAADVTYVPPPVLPPPAPAVQAHVDLYAGFASFEGFMVQGTESVFVFGGAGRANVPLQNNWNLQLDAQGGALVFSSGKGIPEFGGFGHFYARDPGSHALGIYGGADFSSPLHEYRIGVEGQLYWPQFTAYGQASVSSMGYGGLDITAFQLRGEGQWYLTDDTALLGDALWTHIANPGGDADILTLAGTLMARFNSGPFAGFVTGRWDHSSQFSLSSDELSAVVGVRVQADPPGSTLKSHRRTGPAMDVYPIQVRDLVCFGPC